jgi:hypothetical protein
MPLFLWKKQFYFVPSLLLLHTRIQTQRFVFFSMVVDCDRQLVVTLLLLVLGGVPTN